jgi:hypothetical protein
MTQPVFSLQRLRAGDVVRIGSSNANEVYLIEGHVKVITQASIWVCQTINRLDNPEHPAEWVGFGWVDEPHKLSFELVLDEQQLRGDTLPMGQFLVYGIKGKPYVLPLTDVEVNRDNKVIQDLTRL